MASKGTKIVVCIFITIISLLVVWRIGCAAIIAYLGNQAEREMEAGNYEEALDKWLECEKFMVKGEKIETNSAMIGSCYFELGMYEEAIEKFSDAIDENGQENDGIYYTNMGIAYAKLGDYETALEKYMRAMEIDPHYAELYSSLGSLHIRMGEPHLAVMYFEQAIDEDPLLAVAYGNGAYAYALNGDFYKAWEYLGIASRKGYDNVDEIKALMEELEMQAE